MRVTNISMSNEGMPDEVTVTMTLDEAILIAKHTGSLKPFTSTSSSIYFGLTNGLFNRFWEDSVDGAARGDHD